MACFGTVVNRRSVERMTLADLLRDTEAIRGWDWSRCRTRVGDFGWDYVEVVRSHLPDGRVLDVGTGGGEVFSDVARPSDVALDVSLDMLAVARERLPCPLVVGHNGALPFTDASFGLVVARHVGVSPYEAVRVLRTGGTFVTQDVGGRICQNIFDAFGWGTNGAFWERFFAERGEPFWNVAAMAAAFEGLGCEILRRQEAVVEQEFLDEESLAYWLVNAPLPEVPDPDRHADILARLPLKTNWHSELLVVRR